MTTEVVATPEQGATSLMAIIARAANDPQMDVAKLQALLAMKKEWEADEARKAYNKAFADFKAEATRIVKNRVITDGPLKTKRYADLFAVVDAVSPILSKYGLSSSWSITKDEKDWIEVACILTHTAGHSERRTMGGPPDSGGAKNSIQARASTVSYLERYTLLAAVGMASSDQDDDGRGGPEGHDPREDPPDPWTDEIRSAANSAAEAGIYAEWWGKQTAEFRRAATVTQQHADFKAVVK